MSRTIQLAPLRKSLVIGASPERTFEVFTAGIDRWWPKTHSLGSSPMVRSWQPGVRFVVGWEIGADWKPDARVAFTSEVEVQFFAETGGRTRLELEHRNFERMGDAAGEKMRHEVEGGWPKMLELLAQEDARSG